MLHGYFFKMALKSLCPFMYCSNLLCVLDFLVYNIWAWPLSSYHFVILSYKSEASLQVWACVASSAARSYMETILTKTDFFYSTPEIFSCKSCLKLIITGNSSTFVSVNLFVSYKLSVPNEHLFLATETFCALQLLFVFCGLAKIPWKLKKVKKWIRWCSAAIL